MLWPGAGGYDGGVGVLIRPIESVPRIPAAGELLQGARDVHIWYVEYEDLCDPVLLARYRELMTPDERERHGRFVFDRDRHQFLVTRALVRTTLSRYAPVAPPQWRFVANAYGRPEIACAETARAAGLPAWPGPRLWFNLSNTRGLIACAVTARYDEVGVDVEHLDRDSRTIDIADRFFSPREVTALRAVPAARRQERFFVYWTLKEAYIKARGMGLSIPLEQFSFDVDGGDDIRIAFEPELGDSPQAWRFGLFAVARRYLLAAAVRARSPSPSNVRFAAARCVPLADPG